MQCNAWKKSEYTSQDRINSRNNDVRLKYPFCKTNMGQKSLSYMGPWSWNKMSSSMNRNISWNTFKHDVKKYYLQKLRM